MLYRYIRISLLLGVSAAGVATAMPALAQEASAAASSGDIIVTARRTEERLQDVPISITVLNQSQIEAHNIVSGEDLAKTTPSLQVNNNFGDDNTMFALRGFSQDIGSAPTVGTYFADVVAPRGGSFSTPAGEGAGPGAFFDLQNVQVLKGPQGTLQGRNTTGGAVMLVPTKPTRDLEGYVEGTLGNYSLEGVEAVINIPLADTFRVRLGVDRQLRDGYVINKSGIGPRDYGNLNYTAVRLSIVADLTPSLENYTIASYTNSDNHGTVAKLIGADSTGQFSGFALDQMARQQAAGLGFYDMFSNMPTARIHTRQWQIINTTTWQVSDSLKIKNIASYAEYRQFQQAPLFGTDFQITPANGVPSLFQFLGFSGANPAAFSAIAPQLAGLIGQDFLYAETNPYPGTDFTAESTFTEELQFQGHGLDDRLNWQAGFYFEQANPLGQPGTQTATEATCVDITVVNPICSSPLATAQNIYNQYALANGLNPILLNGGYNPSRYGNSLRDTALYAQATYKLTQQLSITGGFRYTWDKQDVFDNPEFIGFSYNPTPGGLPTNNALYCIQTGAPPAAGKTDCQTGTVSNKSSAPTWLIDLDWKPTSDVLVYAKYSRGYRAGGVKPDVEAQVTGPVGAIGAAGITPLPGPYTTYTVDRWKPEKVDAYEVGLKSSFHGIISGIFNVAGFYNRFSNQQLILGFSTLTAPAPGQSSIYNAGKSRIWGIEVDTSLNLFKGFQLNVGYTYLNTKVTSLDQTAAAFGVYNLTGTEGLTIVSPSAQLGLPLTYSPKNKVTINGNYTLPLDSSAGIITLGATFTHTDSQHGTFNDLGIPAQIILPNNTIGTTTDAGLLQATNLLDFDVSWKGVLGSRFDLSAFMTNVTGEHYYTGVPGLLGLGFETAELGAPRMWGIRGKVHF